MSVLKRTGAQLFRLLALVFMLPGLILILSHRYWWLGLILIFLGIALAAAYRQLAGGPLKLYSKPKAGYKRDFFAGIREGAKVDVVFLLVASALIALGFYLFSFPWGTIPGIIFLVIGVICLVLGWPFFLF